MRDLCSNSNEDRAAQCAMTGEGVHAMTDKADSQRRLFFVKPFFLPIFLSSFLITVSSSLG
jgi:hypothetical protein